jgi:pimeloyl-ACP methyl ester carboxylesterase
MRKVGMALLWTLVAVVVVAAALLLVLNRPDISYDKLQARHATPQSHYVDLPGGVRMHYQAFGAPDRPTIVLLHGYADSFLTWRKVADRLSPRFHVIVPDMPGHGLTQAPATFKASADNYAGVLDQFATKANLPRFTVVGNSMGGGVAWQYALAHPEKLTGLVLVDAAGWPAQTLTKPPLAFRILMSAPGRWYLKHFETGPITGPALQADFHDPKLATKAFVDRWIEVQRAPGHRDILMSLGPGPNSVATPEKLAKLSTPTLIIHGADDHIIAPASAEKFHAAIKGSELAMYPATGHLPQWEQPDRTAADIGRFVDAHAGASTAAAG